MHTLLFLTSTPLASLPGPSKEYTILDLKDAFCYTPLDHDSQKIFVFEREDPDTHQKSQYCWAVLPQIFKKSPTLFGESHAKDLRDLQLENGAVLQYVDNILIASPDKETSNRNTLLTLNHLAKKRYQVPQKEAQIFKPEVRFLGLLISRDQEAYVRSAVTASPALPGNQVAE